MLLCYANVIHAQRLPNIQQISLRAPANIKIDGKAIEWGNKFQAYNHATDVFYTICNDDVNLYLVVHTNNPDVLTKITNRGVIFSVNLAGKKSDKNAIIITFPVFELQYGNKPYINFSIMGQPQSQRDKATANPDSVAKVANKKLHDNERYIRTSGIVDVDTLLSVYNTNGIKAREAFDNAMAYTYELAVPLICLNLHKSTITRFSYHISIQGITDNDFGMKITKSANGLPQLNMAAGAVSPTKEHLPVVSSTTDFWGEYILAK